MSEPHHTSLQQYNTVNKKTTLTPPALLLFRLGDFYELFYERCHNSLFANSRNPPSFTYRNREKKKVRPTYTMCGVPYQRRGHATIAHAFIREVSFKSSPPSASKMEQPRAPAKKAKKKLVAAKFTRVITPGHPTGHVDVLDARGT